MSAWRLFRETLRIARQALTANRMRSMLALLGIVIGVATVIAMMSLINGFQRSFQKGIQSWGSNTIYVRTFRPGAAFAGQIPDSLRKRQAFTMDDAAAIRDRCRLVVVSALADGPTGSSPIAFWPGPARGSKSSCPCQRPTT